MNKTKTDRETLIEECNDLLCDGRWYFQKDSVEIIWNDAMDCWIYLDFNTMKFDTADRGKQSWLLRKLSTETMIEELSNE
jgi:hypothetical protein